MRFFFCKATTTLCVHSRKNQRGAAKQNRPHRQNGSEWSLVRAGQGEPHRAGLRFVQNVRLWPERFSHRSACSPFPHKILRGRLSRGPSFAHRVTGALFLFIGHKQCCTSALAKAAQAANIVTLQQVCDKVKRRRFAKRRRPPWNPRSKPNTSWPMP